jgi:uroporphyrinogen-III synthase
MDYADSELGEPRIPRDQLRRRPLRVVLTRAVEQQQAWREAAERAGFEVESLPLFRVEQTSPAALQAAIGKLDDVALIVVISPNSALGLGQLLAHSRQKNLSLYQSLSQVKLAVPGPGTRDALVRRGFKTEHIICPLRRDHSYDTQALLQAVRAAMQFGQLKAGPAIIVHGEQTSLDLATGLTAMGLPNRGVAAYHQAVMKMLPAQTLRLATLLTSAHEVVWVLAQTRAVMHLDALARGLRPAGLAGHRALAIHPRIATAALQAGFGDVRVIEPSTVALVGALVTMAEAAP